MSRILPLVFFCLTSAFGVGQETTVSPERTKSSSLDEQPTIKLRKLFVPADKLGKFISGKFLPMESSRFDQFLLSQTAQIQGRIQGLTLSLKSNGGSQLSGPCFINFPPTVGDNSQVIFRSNLNFSDVRPVQDGVDQAILGNTPDGAVVFESILGGLFQCNASLVSSGREKIFKCRLPESETTPVVYLQVPDSLFPKCDLEMQPVHFAPLSTARGSQKLYRLLVSRNEFLIALTQKSESTFLATSSSFVNIDPIKATIVTKGKLFWIYPEKKRLKFRLPPGFSCTSFTLGNRETSVIQQRPSDQGSVVEMDLNSSSSGEDFQIVAQRDVSSHDSIKLRHPIFENCTNISDHVICEWEKNWEISLLTSIGMHISADELGRLKFVPISGTSLATLGVRRKQERPETDFLSVDAVNNLLVVQQRMGNVAPSEAFLLQPGWKIESVKDPQQPERDLGWSVVSSNGVPQLAMSSAPQDLIIEATKTLEIRRNYLFPEFCPVKVTNPNCQVSFGENFVARVNSNVQAPYGFQLASPADGNPVGSTTDLYSEIKQLRFRFPAEREKHGTSFSYRTHALLSNQQVISNCRIQWDSSKFERLLLDLQADDRLIKWEPIDGQSIVHHLTTVEKQGLGLDLSREIWSVQNADRRKSAVSSLQFQRISEFDEQSAIDILLPQPVLKGTADGVIRITGINHQKQALNVAKVREVPIANDADHQREFESGNGSFIKIVPKLEQASEGSKRTVVDHSLLINQNAMAILDVSVSMDSSDESTLLLSSEQEFDSVSFQYGSFSNTAKKEKEGWRVTLPKVPDNQTILLFKLEYQFNERFLTSRIETPVILINGLALETNVTDFTVDRSFFVFPFQNIYAQTIDESLAAYGWLPTQLFEAATHRDFTLSNSSSYTSSVDLEASTELFLIKVHNLLLIALVTSGFFAGFAIQCRTTKKVFLTFIPLLSVSLFLCYGIAVVLSFALFGLTIGLFLRELRRLCKINMVTSIGILLLVLTNHGTTAQDQQPKNTPIASAIYPVDSQGKSNGLVYLPLNIYDLVTNRSNRQQVLCKSFQVSLSEGVQSDLTACQIRFELHVSNTPKFDFPIFVKDAIYPENAVLLNGNSIDFKVNENSNRIELDTNRKGAFQLEFNFLLRIEENPISFAMPFSGCGRLENQTDRSFQFTPVSEVGTQKGLPPNANLGLGPTKSFSLVQSTITNPEIQIYHWLDFRSSDAVHRLLITSDRPIKTPILVEISDQFSLSGDQFEASAERPKNRIRGSLVTNGTSQVELKCTMADRQTDIGFLSFEPLTVLTHPVRQYWVGTSSSDQSVFQVISPLKTEPIPPGDFEEQWNSKAEFQLPTPAESFSITASERFVLLGISSSVPLMGKTVSNHFLSSGQHLVETKLEITATRRLDSLEFKLPDSFKDVTLALGGRSFQVLPLGGGVFLSPLPALPAGQYQFSLTARSAIQEDNIKLDVVRLSFLDPTQSHFIWSNRERVVDADVLTPPQEPVRKREFFLKGEVLADVQSVQTKPAQEVRTASMAEKLTYENGKIIHEVSFRPTDFQEWAGLNIPLEADNITSDPAHYFCIEESPAFSRKQVWTPVGMSNTKSISFRFSTNISPLGIRPSFLENIPDLKRTIQLPEQIGNDRLIWNLPINSLLISRPQNRTYRINNATSLIQYSLQPKLENEPKIDFSEALYDPPSKTLTMRMFAVPNGVASVVIRIPAAMRLATVTVCGQQRPFDRLPDSQCRFELLDPQLCQYIDLVCLCADDEFELPELEQWDNGDAFFQVRSGRQFQLSFEGTSGRHNEIVARRREFLENAINIYEINEKNVQSSRWNLVNRNLAAIAGLQSQSPTPDNDSLQPQFSVPVQNIPEEIIAASFPVQLLTDRNISIQNISPRNQFKSQGMVLAAILMITLLGWTASEYLGRIFPYFYSLLLLSLSWVGGISWISVAPGSYPGWCITAISALMAGLFIRRFILDIRAKYQVPASTKASLGATNRSA